MGTTPQQHSTSVALVFYCNKWNEYVDLVFPNKYYWKILAEEQIDAGKKCKVPR